MTALRSGTLAAVDVGSTGIACLVARADGEGALAVTGAGYQAARGIEAGAVVDMEAAERPLATAIAAAEEMAGETLRSIWVATGGGQPFSRQAMVEVEVAGSEVAGADLRQAMKAARREIAASERALLHAVARGWRLDGHCGIRDPRGMVAGRLGADLHLIAAAPVALANLETCIGRCHLDVAGRAFAPYMAGLAALSEDEMSLGATVVDMGGGTTGIAVFFGGDCVHADLVPVGGRHVTNDIARMLSTSTETAERLKTLHGSAVEGVGDEAIGIPAPGEGESPMEVPRSTLTDIVRSRVEETLELAKSRLAGLDRFAGRSLVLVGGACQLGGMAAAATRIFGMPARIGRPCGIAGLPEAMAGPAFAAAAGLLRHAAAGDDALAADIVAGGLLGRFGRLGHWLRENL